MKLIDKLIDRLAVAVMAKLKTPIDNKIEANLNLIESTLTEMFGERIDSLERRMASLEEAYSEFEELKEKVDDLDYELDHLKDDVSDLENGWDCDWEEELTELKTKLERIKDIL